MKIYVNGKRCQGSVLAAVAKMMRILSEAGNTLVADATYYAKMPIGDAVDMPFHDVTKSVPDDIDLALSIGGDGTFLRMARQVASKDVPIAGVNTGRLGYLTAADISEMEDFVADLMRGNYTTESRAMLQVRRPDGVATGNPVALNEVAFLRHDSSAVVNISVEVDGEHLTTYKADGLIVSTPTGSTAYNLSCGGPIIAPTAANIVLTPVSPHSLNMRPLVLPDSVVLKVTTHTRAKDYQLSLDGNAIILADGSDVEISRAPYMVKVVQRNGRHSFISTLRSKLLWGEDIR